MSPFELGDRLRLVQCAPVRYELSSDRGLVGFFSWLPSEYPNAEVKAWDGQWVFRRPGRRGWRIVGSPVARSGDRAASLSDEAAARYRRRVLQPGGTIQIGAARWRLIKEVWPGNRWRLSGSARNDPPIAHLRSQPAITLSFRRGHRDGPESRAHRIEIETIGQRVGPPGLSLLCLFCSYVVVLEDAVAAAGVGQISSAQ
jgi:hypothetical protein